MQLCFNLHELISKIVMTEILHCNSREEFLVTVLLSKRVNNYQCMFIADVSDETCMYPDLTWYPVRSMDGLSTPPVAG